MAHLGLLGFGRLRFPFTFMGVLALAIGLWVVVYLVGHRTLDPLALIAASLSADWPNTEGLEQASTNMVHNINFKHLRFVIG